VEHKEKKKECPKTYTGVSGIKSNIKNLKTKHVERGKNLPKTVGPNLSRLGHLRPTQKAGREKEPLTKSIGRDSAHGRVARIQRKKVHLAPEGGEVVDKKSMMGGFEETSR